MSLHSVLRHFFKTRRISYGGYVYFRSDQSEILTYRFFPDMSGTGSSGGSNTREVHTTQILRSKSKKSSLEKIKITEETHHKNATVEADVPLIVKILKQQMEDQKQEMKPQQALSVEKLQKSLEDIKWDRDASLRRDNIDEFVQDSEPDGTHIRMEGATLDMNYIEDIFVDDEIHIHRSNARKTFKQKVTGTPDPSIPKSDVPCSGCGAILHCQDPIIPGYIQSEKFKCLTRDEMRTSVCQRCFLIQVYKMYLKVNVSADTYPSILKEIRTTKALVLVVVDLFDMKNSVYRDLLKYIGTNRPLFVVGNKVDLIPSDSSRYLERTKQALIEVCESAGLNPTGKNIKHVCMVSAKTGYGIEELVTKLMTLWKLQGHVYVVGSTNAGKSTLFNALLMSDYCKSVARGFINRATVSVWPGTTLNLLKFPIISPEPWRLILRAQRLNKDRAKIDEEEVLRQSRLLEHGSNKAAVLTGHIGLTDFRSAKTIAEDEAKSGRLFSGHDIVSFVQGKAGDVLEVSGQDQLGKGPQGHEYKPENFQMYWCNDTPGVVNLDQIINLLEPDELVAILPKTYVLPQSIIIKPGQVLFVSGLGRIDFLEGQRSIYLTVHTAHTVPLHVKDYNEADEFYRQAFGTNVLGIPLGDNERLAKIPSLIGKEFHITGTEVYKAAADIQLSSLGWVSVAAASGQEVTLRAYTPGGRGLHQRTPALLADYSKFKGKRKGKTPFFHQPKVKA